MDNFYLPYLNCIEIKDQGLILPVFNDGKFKIYEDYTLNITSKPRIEYKMPESFIGKKWRNVWLFRNSVFQDQKLDSDELI